jgi:aminoglycoside 3-N-acetyltransferase
MPPPAITRSCLAAELCALGLRPGGVVMVHTRMSALGWVVGGSETVVRALLDALGPDGTLAAYASWQEHVYNVADWPAEHRAGYLAEPPVFDPATGEAARDHGRIPERIRTWPGARRSAHPEASVVAVGARAEWLTSDHPHDDAYGAGTPFARLVDAGGQVLMLGAPLETVTLLHHAEAIADVADKRRVTYDIPVLEDGGVVQRRYDDIETSEGAFAYETDADPFEVIAVDALRAGIGVKGRVGEADCHLFPAPELTAFAKAWMEERFR